MLTQIMQHFETAVNQLETVVVHPASAATNVYKSTFPIDITLMSVRENDEVGLAQLQKKFLTRVRNLQGAGIMHQHDFVELVYVHSGTYSMRTEQKMLDFHAKEFCLIDRTLAHQDIFCNKPCVVFFIAMSSDFFDSVFLNDLAGNKLVMDFIIETIRNKKSGESFLRIPAGQNAAQVEYCLDNLVRELYRQELGYSYLCKGYMMRLLDLLTPGAYSGLKLRDKKEIQKLLFDEVVLYMSEHLSSVTAEELSAAFHFQRSYFNRLIKKHTNQSFTQLLQDMRLKRAAELLCHTELAVTEIVMQVGYRNMGHFYELFTAKYGATPAVYRRHMLEKD